MKASQSSVGRCPYQEIISRNSDAAATIYYSYKQRVSMIRSHASLRQSSGYRNGFHCKEPMRNTGDSSALQVRPQLQQRRQQKKMPTFTFTRSSINLISSRSTAMHLMAVEQLPNENIEEPVHRDVVFSFTSQLISLQST